LLKRRQPASMWEAQRGRNQIIVVSNSAKNRSCSYLLIDKQNRSKKSTTKRTKRFN
jgi:hypothetical protein